MKLPGFLITIDFVNLNFLIKTLEAFNFGLSFMRWASSLNCNLMSCIRGVMPQKRCAPGRTTFTISIFNGS